MICKWQCVRGAVSWLATLWMRHERTFRFDGNEYEYFDRLYSYTPFNERRVEIPVVRRALAGHGEGNVLEVGNVLSHYMPIAHRVIDKYERASIPGFENAAAVTYVPTSRFNLIISISTMVHAGWDEFPRDRDRVEAGLGNLVSLLNLGGELLCSFPMGYNGWLDELVLNADMPFKKVRYLRPDAGEVSRLLDCGCGDGTYMMEQASQVPERAGFEPEPAQAERVATRLGIPGYSDFARLSRECFGRMNVVTAHFVLEHVADLQETFRIFAQLLRPGGLLHVAVPNIRSWEERLFGRHWHGLDPPRHLSFPEPKYFLQMATEHDFDAPRFSFASFPNTLAGSLSACLAGHYIPLLLIALAPLCAPVSMLAPQGTWIVRMRRKGVQLNA